MPPLDRNVAAVAPVCTGVEAAEPPTPRRGREPERGRGASGTARRPPRTRPQPVALLRPKLIIRVSAGRGRARRLTWSVAPARHVL